MNEQNLKEVTISFDLFCEWEDVPPIYRIYVDNDLLVERTYIWHNSEQYIRENIVVMLASGTHYFNVDIPNFHEGNYKLTEENIIINGIPRGRTPDDIIKSEFTI